MFVNYNKFVNIINFTLLYYIIILFYYYYIILLLLYYFMFVVGYLRRVLSRLHCRWGMVDNRPISSTNRCYFRGPWTSL